MGGSGSRRNGRAAWILAAAGSAFIASASMAQSKEDKKAPPPAAKPAPQPPPPAAKPPPQQAPRPAPPKASPPPASKPPAPPASKPPPAPQRPATPPPQVNRPAPPPAAQPPKAAPPARQPSPPAVRPQAPQTTVQPPKTAPAPPRTQPPAVRPPTAVPSPQAPTRRPPQIQPPTRVDPPKSTPTVRPPSGNDRPSTRPAPRPRVDPIRPAPNQPWSNVPRSKPTPTTNTPPKSTGGDTPITRAPDRPKGPSWTTPSRPTGPITKAKPNGNAPKGGDAPKHAGTPKNYGGSTGGDAGSTRKPWTTPDSRADAKAPRKPDDFTKPIRPPSSPTPTRIDADKPTNFADQRGRPRPDRHGGGGSNTSLSVGVGLGAGISFTTSHWFGSKTFVSFSFNDTFCDYDPWISPTHCWYRPHHWGHHWGHHHWDPYWHCNPWGGFYYSRCHYPLWWCYPGYSWSVYSCGPWFRISYHRPACHWLTSFTYVDAPCHVFSDCSLISPTVIVTAYEPPAFNWSTTTVYRHSYVNTVYAEAPVQSSGLVTVDDGLPAPASDAELASTTERELADTYMKLGDTDSAIRVYSAHTARHPGDVLAVRALGMALIDRGEVEAGTAQVERAYRIDPTLARRPFDRELLRDPDTLIAVLDKATALAGQLDGKPGAAAAWLTVAVLMQSDGRDDPAREAIEKAKAAGLSQYVVDEMQAAVPVS